MTQENSSTLPPLREQFEAWCVANNIPWPGTQSQLMSAFQAGAASRQAEIDALKADVERKQKLLDDAEAVLVRQREDRLAAAAQHDEAVKLLTEARHAGPHGPMPYDLRQRIDTFLGSIK